MAASHSRIRGGLHLWLSKKYCRRDWVLKHRRAGKHLESAFVTIYRSELASISTPYGFMFGQLSSTKVKREKSIRAGKRTPRGQGRCLTVHESGGLKTVLASPPQETFSTTSYNVMVLVSQTRASLAIEQCTCRSHTKILHKEDRSARPALLSSETSRDVLLESKSRVFAEVLNFVAVPMQGSVLSSLICRWPEIFTVIFHLLYCKYTPVRSLSLLRRRLHTRRVER